MGTNNKWKFSCCFNLQTGTQLTFQELYYNIINLESGLILKGPVLIGDIRDL